MDSLREMRRYVGQHFDAQDARLDKIQASIQRWENATTFNMSPRQFYSTLNEHGTQSTPNPNPYGTTVL